jgi:hypothetical protein
MTHSDTSGKVRLVLTGGEPLTQEKFLCEASVPTGYKTYTLDTAGGGKEAGGFGVRPALCFEFVDMPPTEKCFLEFSDRWGLLETRTKLAPPGWERSKGRMDIGFDTTSVSGQGILKGFIFEDIWPSAISFSELAAAHGELRLACVLWRLLDYGNMDRLSEIFYIGKLDGREDGLICRFTHSRELKGEEKTGSDAGYDVKWKHNTQKNEMIVSAYSELFRYVESGDIAAMTVITLNRLFNRNLPQRVDTRSILRRDMRALLPATRATTLLGALWLQLFMAVCGERSLRRCTLCGEWDTKKNLRQGKYHRRCWDREYRHEKRAKAKA